MHNIYQPKRMQICYLVICLRDKIKAPMVIFLCVCVSSSAIEKNLGLLDSVYLKVLIYDISRKLKF